MALVEIYFREMCGYSSRALQLLRTKDIDFVEYDATMNADLRAEMVKRADGRNTFPQIFIDGVGIGGCDDLFALNASGELDEMLKSD